MGQPVYFVIADNPAVSFQVVEAAEQIVYQVGVVCARVIQFNQSAAKLLKQLYRLVNEIFKMAFAKGREGI